MADRRVRNRIEKSFDVPSPNSENGYLVRAIVDDGRTWSQGLVFIQNVGHSGQDLKDFVDVLRRKLEREGVRHNSVFDMYTAALLSALWADIDAGAFTSQFYGGASNVSSGSLSVNSSARSDANEDAGYGDQLTYYVALQGEGANQKLLVLLRADGRTRGTQRAVDVRLQDGVTTRVMVNASRNSVSDAPEDERSQ